ncbi:MAG: segregation/condensation protein A [Planctomycetota bacterium]|nr:segregation/condensation protein A [Planctomycetota bacterium]MDA0917515.1 segregation/condensation protein A [Planctomycetota bacterium]MDA1158367.1 segregation/condensation protein A [Planctomycetota bacterium]
MPTYRVELDIFKGPLDLLLYLVRRDELDPLNLPLASIVHEFEKFIDLLEFLDLEMIGDFVVMASTLVEIKSRMALPAPEEDEVPEGEIVDDDPSSDLIKRLLEYRKYKQAATALEEHAAEWQERYPRLSSDRPRVGNEPASDLIKEVELWDLVSALARVLEKKILEQEAKIRDDDTPIHVYVERVGTLVREKERVAFTSLFDDANRKSQIVGIFLAILELLRHHSFRAEQTEDFGEIWVMPPLSDASRDEGRLAELPATDGDAIVEDASETESDQ